MKLRIMLTLALLAASLAMLSCAIASSAIGVEVSCEDFQESSPNSFLRNEFQVSIGDTITIELCSNPTTGFKWEYETIGKIVLEETDYGYVAPESDETVGATGKEVWTFKAIEKGTTELLMEYSRSWEGGEQAEWTYTDTVTVE